MDLPVHDVIRVFDHDPDLLAGLEPSVAEHVQTRLGARRAWAEPGVWTPRFAPEETVGHLGLLVVDGLLVRTIRLGDREGSEVIGPGDLLRPWDGDDPGASVDSCNEWRVLAPTTFAVLDPAFAADAARFPPIIGALLGRSARRCRALVYQGTIARVRHSDTRVLLALWHLADRWGRVTSEGVRVPVPLTHQLLAQVTCLQRPTVSAAVSRLRAGGQVDRAGDGAWVLFGEPPRLGGDGTPLVAA